MKHTHRPSPITYIHKPTLFLLFFFTFALFQVCPIPLHPPLINGERGGFWEYSGTAIAGGWTTRGGANTGGGLSNNAGESEEPSLALDSSNNSHIAWTDHSGGGL